MSKTIIELRQEFSHNEKRKIQTWSSEYKLYPVYKYKVLKLVNTTTPHIGNYITQTEVDRLIDNPQNVVKITGSHS